MALCISPRIGGISVLMSWIKAVTASLSPTSHFRTTSFALRVAASFIKACIWAFASLLDTETMCRAPLVTIQSIWLRPMPPFPPMMIYVASACKSFWGILGGKAYICQKQILSLSCRIVISGAPELKHQIKIHKRPISRINTGTCMEHSILDAFLFLVPTSGFRTVELKHGRRQSSYVRL